MLVLVLLTLPEEAAEEEDEMEGVVAVLTFGVPLDDAAVEADVDDEVLAPMEKDPVEA